MKIQANDVLALLPFIYVSALALVVVVLDAFHRTDKSRTYIATIGWVGLLPGLALTTWIAEKVPAGLYFNDMVYHDGFTTFFNLLFIGAAALTLMLSPDYLRERKADRGEFYSIVLMSTTGMMIMGSSADLVMTFIGLEVMSVGIYVLAGFFRRQPTSAEGAAKYFFLGAFASAIFLYGMALLYGVTGSTGLEGIATALQQSALGGDNTLVLSADDPLAATGLDPLFFIGALMLLAGLSFKVALVPFHMWTPDAYTGAPSTATGFMASAVKAAGFAALLRVAFIALGPEAARFEAFGWVQILFYLALITMIVGNLTAIVQSNVKRMLAYSSIAHAGYIAVGIAAAGYIGVGGETDAAGYLSASSVLFYLGVYAIATIGAFGCLAYLSTQHREIDTYDDLSGVAKKHPAVAAAMAIFMFSSAGIPPTAGFVAKFHVFRTAIVAGGESGDSAFVWLVIIAVLASVAGAYYYLRVVVHMYMKPMRGTVGPKAPRLIPAIALGLCAAGSIWYGVIPAGGLSGTEKAMTDFQGVRQTYGMRGVGPEARSLGSNKVEAEPEAAPNGGPGNPAPQPVIMPEQESP